MEAEGTGSAYRTAQTGDRQSRKETRTDSTGDGGSRGSGSGICEGRIGEKSLSEEARECQGAGGPGSRQGEREDRTPPERTLNRGLAKATSFGRRGHPCPHRLSGRNGKNHDGQGRRGGSAHGQHQTETATLGFAGCRNPTDEAAGKRAGEHIHEAARKERNQCCGPQSR